MRAGRYPVLEDMNVDSVCPYHLAKGLIRILPRQKTVIDIQLAILSCLSEIAHIWSGLALSDIHEVVVVEVPLTCGRRDAQTLLIYPCLWHVDSDSDSQRVNACIHPMPMPIIRPNSAEAKARDDTSNVNTDEYITMWRLAL